MEQQPSSDLLVPESDATLPFTDTVEHSLDAKYRVVLPAGVRPAFGAGGMLTVWDGPCVAVLTAPGFRSWVDHLRRVLPGSGFDDPNTHVKLAHAQAATFKPDAQGRFLLPERFRFAAGIDRALTVIGVGSRIELWNPATYGRDLDELRQNLAFLQSSYDLDIDGP